MVTNEPESACPPSWIGRFHVYQPFFSNSRVMFFTSTHSFQYLIPFSAVCCCPLHLQWRFGDPRGSSLVSKKASECYMNFCDINLDKKHNDRKRKICVACANVIDVEGPNSKRIQLEVSSPKFVVIMFTFSDATKAISGISC